MEPRFWSRKKKAARDVPGKRKNIVTAEELDIVRPSKSSLLKDHDLERGSDVCLGVIWTEAKLIEFEPKTVAQLAMLVPMSSSM